MSQPGYPPSAGERWNVNMPAVIGVVFVFLLGVVIWVVFDSSGGDDPATGAPGTSASTDATAGGDTVDTVDGGTTTATGAPGTNGTTGTTGTTSPAPMPDPSAVTTAAPEATTTTAPVPVTPAPGTEPGAASGDLGIPGRPMQRPACTGAYITLIASAIGDQATAGGIANVLEAYPGSNYLRTDQTCPSLTQSVDGQPVYVVYFGPFGFESDACTARAEGPEGSYARQLSDDVGPDHTVACT